MKELLTNVLFYVWRFILYMIFMVGVITIIQKVEAAEFPMWATCKVPATKKEAKKIKIPPTSFDVQFGIKNWELEKTIMVRVFSVDNKCAWVYTGGEVLIEGTKPSELTCIPEKNCQPMFRGLYGNRN